MGRCRRVTTPGNRAEASRAQAGRGAAGGGATAAGTCWVDALAHVGSDNTPPWSLTAASINRRSCVRAAVTTGRIRSVQKVPRSEVCSRAARMWGGTSAVHAIAAVTAPKGVVSGRAATDCHSRSAHCWHVSSPRVRNSPASRYRP